jgi:16S rRNA (uracil1498-N3)-methyltransferase
LGRAGAISGAGRATVTPSLLYVPGLEARGAALDLSPDEAHYVSRVCRARAGDIAEATDGRGALARLRLLSVGASVRAEVVSLEQVERDSRAWLMCGAPERGRADWLVEKLAELGIERFQPLEIRGAPWDAGARNGRWNRLAIAALRQSRRPFLMEIQSPLPLEAALESLESAAGRWLGDPAGRPAGAVARSLVLSVGAIGPSGGFGPSERERLDGSDFVPIRLATGRLRTETAALSLAAWMSLPLTAGG